MKNGTMQKEIVEMSRSRFVRDKGPGMARKGESECILFCKRRTSNIFDIKDGFAVVAGVENCFNDGVSMIVNFAKVVFVFDRTEKR